MIKGVRYASGGIEQLTLSANISMPSPNYAEITIKVVCTTANSSDMLPKSISRCGMVKEYDEIIGTEVAGYVHDVSQQKHTNWKVGDRVMALVMGRGNAEYTCVPETMVMPVPMSMNFTIAACIPDNWINAYQLIYTIGQVQYKDSVLIHLADSGIGIAAIQLCSIIGASCHACVNSDDHAERVIDLGATSAINCRTQDLVEVVLKATRGSGVNVILDCMGGMLWKQNSAVIATDGKWIIYGLQGGAEVLGDCLSVIVRKRVTLVGSDLRGRSQEVIQPKLRSNNLPTMSTVHLFGFKYKNDLVGAFTTSILPRLENGRVTPIVDRVLPFHEIAKAHMILEDGQQMGKIVLQVCQEEEMEKVSYRLPKDSSRKKCVE